MKKRKTLRKSLGVLFLAGALICTVSMPAFAEEPESGSLDSGNLNVELPETETQENQTEAEETQKPDVERSTVDEDEFSTMILADDETFSTDVQVIKFHGDEEIKFTFRMGANNNTVSQIKSIGYSVMADVGYMGGTGSEGMDTGFTFNMEEGFLIIDKDWVIQTLNGMLKYNLSVGGKNLTEATFTAYAEGVNGESVELNDWGTWVLDLTEYVGVEEELKIVPEATDYTYTKGDQDGATITCTGEVEDFVSVFVDDMLVDPSNYILERGSTILTFTTKYLNTLSVGKHAVTLNYTYGSVDTELTVQARTNSGGGSGSSSKSEPSSPQVPAEPEESAAASTLAVPTETTNPTNVAVQTGDDTSVILCLLTAIFAFGTCGVIGWKRYSGKL